jgi:hypothetical protein
VIIVVKSPTVVSIILLASVASVLVAEAIFLLLFS